LLAGGELMAWNRAQPMTPIVSSTPVKVAILIPHRDETDYRAWRHRWKDEMEKPPGTSYLESRGLSLTTNRTKLVEMALKTDATHFFFLDDDVMPPPDIIPALLATGQPLACGLYMAKKSKDTRGLAAWMHVNGGYASIDLKQEARYAQVDVTGLGCVMIHRSIFEKLSKPWFVWEPDGVSEDFFFFEKVAKELDVKPMADMTMHCLHIGVFTVDTNGDFNTLEL